LEKYGGYRAIYLGNAKFAKTEKVGGQYANERAHVGNVS
jgi:hypothetical protein